MQRPLGTLLKTSMWCDCLSESKWLLKHKDGCPYFSSHIRTYKSEGVMHRNALHAEQIMCQMSTSCHRRASFLWPNRTEQRAFVGSKMILAQNNRLLPQRLTAQWTHLGCPGPKHSVFMRPGTTTVETCPPKWGLTVWWPSKQGCAISLSLFPTAGKSFAGGSLLTYWKPPAIEISMFSEQTGTMETFAGVERQGEQISLFYTETASFPAH